MGSFFQLLEVTCNPIINTPKPKVEPPKEEAKKEGEKADDKTTVNEGEKKMETEENGTRTAGGDESSINKESSEKPDMELD